jgi:ribonuclease R
VFPGRIGGVTRAGLFVRLDDTGADGFIPAATLGGQYFRYDDGAHALIGNDDGETYRLGDAVTVRLVEAAPVAGALRFEMLSDGRRDAAARAPAKGLKQGRSGKEPKKGRRAAELRARRGKRDDDGASGRGAGRARKARPVKGRR